MAATALSAQEKRDLCLRLYDEAPEAVKGSRVRLWNWVQGHADWGWAHLQIGSGAKEFFELLKPALHARRDGEAQ